MAINDHLGEPVLGGTFLYGGASQRRVEIVACNYDRVHAMRVDEALHVGDSLDDLPAPRPMGPDGVLFHVRGTSCPDCETVGQAKAWAEAQPWAPVVWDE